MKSTNTSQKTPTSTNWSRRAFLRATGTLGIVGTVGSAGCVSGENESGGNETGGNGSNKDSGSNNLVWDAGGTGGTYYPLSNEIKQIAQSGTKYKIQVRSTGATVENIGSLSDGSADFAMMQNDLASYAREGIKLDTFKNNAVESLRGVGSLYPEPINIVTPGNSDIQEVADLSGKTVNTGDLGSGIQANSHTILEAIGVTDYAEQNTDLSQAAEQIQNGDIDAMILMGGWPVGAIAELAQTMSINIVAIDGQERQKIKDKNSFFTNVTIPAGVYEGINEAKSTIAAQAMIATTTQVPKEVVRTVTAAVFDNVSDLTLKSEFITLDSAQKGMSIELHPGAAAYFESKSGTASTTNSEAMLSALQSE